MAAKGETKRHWRFINGYMNLFIFNRCPHCLSNAKSGAKCPVCDGQTISKGKCEVWKRFKKLLGVSHM